MRLYFFSFTSDMSGQLAGAFYGVKKIPESWLQRLAKREFSIEITDRFALAEIASGGSIYDKN